MIDLPLLEYDLQTRAPANGMTQVFDPVRRIWVALRPEEHVRQLLLAYLIRELQYPPALMAVERGLSFGHTILRFDIAVYHRDTHEPWMLVECKAPDCPISDTTLQQLLQYHSKLPLCRYWLITNGHQTFCADAGQKEDIKWLNALPAY